MQLTLEGQTKDQVAIERIREFEPPEGYYGAFSGGKDSEATKELTDMAGVKVEWFYHLTTVDPPPLVKFIRSQYPEVKIVRPKKTMWQLIDEHGTLPTRTVRFCCEDLKEVGGVGRLCLTGIRWAESPRRANRKMLEVDKKGRGKRFLHPIIDWTDDDVWQFIRERGLPYCSMYDEGWKRLGCVLCPMAAPSSIQREIERFPKIVQAWHNAALRVYQRGGKMSHWQSGDDYFNWWLSREGLKDSQQATFDDCLVPFSD